MKNQNYKALLSIAALSLLLTACVNTEGRLQIPPANPVTNPDDVPYQVTEDYTKRVVSYTVQGGDSLGGIALEFTGLFGNWRKIAKHNNISNPNSINKGMVLEIPMEMIPGYQPKNQTPNTQTRNNVIQNAPTVPSSTLAVRRNQSDVVVTPINTNRDFKLSPFDESSLSEPRSFVGDDKQIKVVGTYYPKSIYAEPAYSSKMIMRVAPGELFVLESQINDWYKIQVNGAAGYIRTNDATITK